MITEATPITTPISVRMVRILLAHSDCSASLKASRSGMILNVYDTHSPEARFHGSEHGAALVPER